MPIRASAFADAARTLSSGSRRRRVSSSTASFGIFDRAEPVDRGAAHARVVIVAGLLEIGDGELADLLADAVDGDPARLGVLALQHLVRDLRRLRMTLEHRDRGRRGDAIVLIAEPLEYFVGQIVELDLGDRIDRGDLEPRRGRAERLAERRDREIAQQLLVVIAPRCETYISYAFATPSASPSASAARMRMPQSPSSSDAARNFVERRARPHE